MSTSNRAFYMYPVSLGSQLDMAWYVKYDYERQITMAWFGGHFIHAYDLAGKEVAAWSVGDFARDEVDFGEVDSSMDHRIKHGDYPFNEESKDKS